MMTVQKDRVVSIEYELKDPSGTIIDSSKGAPDLVYIHGNGYLIPGLEKELEGKKVNDVINCVVQPAEAYGERDEELVFSVPRSQFGDAEKIEPGMQFQAEQEDGIHIVTVVSADSENVTIDANHPLAGIPLHFNVKINDIREATPEELEHGHVHGAGCGDECGDDCGCGCGCGD